MLLDLAIYATCMSRLGDKNVVMIGMWLRIRSPFGFCDAPLLLKQLFPVTWGLL